MCSYFMLLSFNIMETILSSGNFPFLYLYHSGETKEKSFETDLFFLSVVLPFRRMLSIFPLCSGLLDFSLNVLDDRHERVDESND